MPAAVAVPGGSGVEIVSVSGAELLRQAHALREATGLAAGEVVLDLVTGTGDGPPAMALASLLARARRIAPDDAESLEGEELLELFDEHAPQVLVLADHHLRELERLDWRGVAGLRVLVMGPVDDERSAHLAERVAVCTVAVELPQYLGVVATRNARTPWHPRVLSSRNAQVQGPPAASDDARPGTASIPDLLIPGVLTLPEPSVFDRPPITVRRHQDGIDLTDVAPSAHWIGGLMVPDAVIADAVRMVSGAPEVVVARCADQNGALRLVAYVRGVPAPTAADLREPLQHRLPRRAIPAFTVEVDEWPLDDHGLVELSQLPNPTRRHAALRRRSLDTPAERLLGALWCELLGVAAVVPDDNFFALGGYSLLCFQMLDRVVRDTGRRIDPRLVLFGTLEQAARILGEEDADASAALGAG